MSNPATDVFTSPKQADSLIRADALEREITDLCARIAASVVSPSVSKPWPAMPRAN